MPHRPSCIPERFASALRLRLLILPVIVAALASGCSGSKGDGQTLTQVGEISPRHGRHEVFYPAPYAVPPSLSWKNDTLLGQTRPPPRYKFIEQRSDGFVVEILALYKGHAENMKIKWIARGIPATRDKPHAARDLPQRDRRADQPVVLKTFVREYTYRASEHDSRVTAKDSALAELRRLLLEEVGVTVSSTLSDSVRETDGALHEDYRRTTKVQAENITKTKVLREKWDGKTFYVKAEVTVDVGGSALQ